MTTSPPDPSARIVDPNGRVDPVWDRWLRSMWRQLTDATSSTGTLSSGKAAVEQPFAEGLLIEFADDKSYPFVELGFDATITEVVTKTTSGSCTVTVTINSTPLGGGASSATTTKSTTYHESNNALTAGDDITITVSSNSSAEGVSVTLKGTRTFAA